MLGLNSARSQREKNTAFPRSFSSSLHPGNTSTNPTKREKKRRRTYVLHTYVHFPWTSVAVLRFPKEISRASRHGRFPDSRSWDQTRKLNFRHHKSWTFLFGSSVIHLSSWLYLPSWSHLFPPPQARLHTILFELDSTSRFCSCRVLSPPGVRVLVSFNVAIYDWVLNYQTSRL